MNSDRLTSPPMMMAVTLVTGVLAALPGTGPLRLLAGLTLVLILPGMALSRAILSRRLTRSGDLVLIPALSMAIVILLGVVLHYVRDLGTLSWAVSLTSVTLALFLLAWWRNPDAADKSPANATPLIVLRRHVDLRNVLMFAAAAGLFTSAAIYSYVRMKEYRQFEVTEFWMVPSGSENGHYTLGMRNRERKTRRFQIELYVNERLNSKWDDLILKPGERWLKDFDVPPASDGPGTARADLYLMQDYPLLYRRVWSAGNNSGSRSVGGAPNRTSVNR